MISSRARMEQVWRNINFKSDLSDTSQGRIRNTI